MASPENRCSFCGKKQSEVRLIAGPGVLICSQCVALCNEILSHDPSSGGAAADRPPASPERGSTVRAEITPD